jgi:tetratricopeptide (TPR) repeat protein
MKKWILLWSLLFIKSTLTAQPSDYEAFEKLQSEAWDLIFIDPQSALSRLTELKQEAGNYPDSHLIFAYNSLAVCNSILGNNQEAIAMIDSAIKLSGADPKGINLLLNKSMIYIHSGNFEKSFELLNQAKIQAQEQEDYKSLQTVYEELGTIYSEFGDYERSLSVLLKSKELNSKIPSPDLKATIINKQKIGNLYLKLRNYEFSKKLLGEAIAEFKENKMMDAYYTAYIGYCDILFKTDAHKTLDSLLGVLIPEVVEFGSQKLLAFYLTIQANYFTEIGNPSEAMTNFEGAYNIYAGTSYAGFHRSLFIQYLDFLQKEGASEKALKLYQRHQSEFENLTYKYRERLYYHSVLYKIFLDLNDLEEAIAQLISRDHLHDSIDAGQARLLGGSTASQYLADYYESKQLENEETIQSLMNSRRMAGIALIALAGGLVIFILILVGINWSWKRKMKGVRAEVEKWKKKHHEIIGIVDDMAKVPGIPIPTSYLAPPGKIPTLSLELSMEKQLQFQQQILNAQKELVTKLKQNHPNLSSKDLVLCALLANNYSAKEISKILDINQKSVATKKMRLVKKLNLESAFELDAFLEAL